MSPAHARHVPVRRVTHGDSRSLTEQPAALMTCAAAGPPVAATSYASRGQQVTARQSMLYKWVGLTKPSFIEAYQNSKL